MKCLVWMFVFVLAIGLVCAADGWGDINDGNDFDDVALAVTSPQVPSEEGNDSGDVATSPWGSASDDEDEPEPEDYVGDYVTPDYSGEVDGKYNVNFYVALGLGVVGLLIVGYFIYLFIQSPRNRWKSRK